MPSSYLLLNGLRFHYLHWNLDGTSRPVVLLHELAGNARLWEPVAAYLAAAGLILLAPDLRGHGLTDRPDGDYGLSTQALDLAAFLEANDLSRPVLVGHSWGAFVVLDYAARFSFGPRAPAGIALVAGEMHRGNASEASWEDTISRLPQPVQAGTPVASYLENLQDGVSGWQLPEEAIPLILASFEVGEDETLTPRLSTENHKKILQAIHELNPYEALRRVRCPVFLVASSPQDQDRDPGQASPVLRESGQERAGNPAPDLTIHRISGSDHNLPIQKPQELAELLLNFIGTIPS